MDEREGNVLWFPLDGGVAWLSLDYWDEAVHPTVRGSYLVPYAHGSLLPREAVCEEEADIDERSYWTVRETRTMAYKFEDRRQLQLFSTAYCLYALPAGRGHTMNVYGPPREAQVLWSRGVEEDE